MTRRIPAVCVVLVLLGAVPATAQTAQQERLKGLTAVDVLIEGLSDQAASCGVTETGLTTAASKALLDNGVRVDASARPTLYVNVNTMYLDQLPLNLRQCVSNIGVKLHSFLTATVPHSAQPVFGKFMLADGHGMNASSSANHGQRTRDFVFELVEAIAVDIRIANQ
ncbi:hypothetical protein JYU09_00920 [bacterium AH-315-O15]|nr:hypothetical protein [bacterium AH-315-O15]